MYWGMMMSLIVSISTTHHPFIVFALFLACINTASTMSLLSAASADRVSISVSDAFDGGNGKLVETRPNENDFSVTDVVVSIKPDVYTELEKMCHMQYFCFRATVSGITTKKKTIKYSLNNAHATSYPEAWTGSTVFCTQDVGKVDSWQRCVDTFYTEGKLTWEHEHVRDGSWYFAYFPPFSYARHLRLIAACEQSATCCVMSLGQSLDGREIECVKIGTGKTVCWIQHRQHPGESMAEHYAEGLLQRLLGLGSIDDKDNDSAAVTVADLDETVQSLRSKYTFYIVPNMNPDGSVRGHLRTNACGANLNREWTTKGDYIAPTLERSPEVYWVLKKMDETGVDCFLDIHGDEELPYNFISGSNGVPAWGPRLESLHGAFTAAYSRANPDMQQKFGYPPSDAESAQNYMNVATNQVANRFNCLAATLEMPFKDCRSNPDPAKGWSPARSRTLGASVLEALAYVHPLLRAEDDFWTKLPAEDAYVATTDDYQTNEGAVDDGQFKMLKKRFYSDVHEIHKK